MAIGLFKELLVLIKSVVDHYNSDFNPGLVKAGLDGFNSKVRIAEMNNNYGSFLLHFLRNLCWFSALAIIVYITYQNLIPSGKLKLKTDFRKIKPGISDIGPYDRVIRKSGTRVIRGEPVYFQVDTLYSFDKMRLSLSVKDMPELPIYIGPKISSLWRYEFRKYENKSEEFAWKPYWNDRKIEIAISIPELLKKGESMTIDAIEVELIREPLSFKRFKKYIKNLYGKVLGKTG